MSLNRNSKSQRAWDGVCQAVKDNKAIQYPDTQKAIIHN